MIHPLTYPHSRHRQLLRNALHFWHEGDAEIRAPHRAAARLRYELAVGYVLRGMRHLTTMEALLGSYYVDRAPLMRLTERACRTADGTRPLSRIWVRDAAFWRRLRQQLATSSPTA